MNVDNIKNSIINIKKFNWQEAFNAANGKTQMSNIMAFLFGLTACIMCFTEPSNVVIISLLIGTSGSLLGIQQLSKTKEITAPTITEEVK